MCFDVIQTMARITLIRVIFEIQMHEKRRGGFDPIIFHHDMWPTLWILYMGAQKSRFIIPMRSNYGRLFHSGAHMLTYIHPR